MISSKAGYLMWDGPYGEWGTRKSVLASLDQSFRRACSSSTSTSSIRIGSTRTPRSRRRWARCDQAVRSGRALYAGISSYGPEKTREAAALLADLGTPCLIHQPSYSLLNRWIEGGLTDVLRAEGIGCIAFSPLAQGLLTNKYLDGIPADSRAAEGDSFDPAFVNEANIDRVRGLRSIADGRGQSLAQMALSWVLRDDVVTSALIGASRWEQIAECIGALEQTAFSDEELATIDEFAVDAGVNLWAESSNAG